jgi:uncharacterized protein (TIGR03437 family)
MIYAMKLSFLLGTALLLAGTCAAAQMAGPNLNATRAAGNQTEPSVAISPSNNTQIFLASRNEAGGLYTARSSDAGATWTTQLIARSAAPASGDIPRAYGNPSVAWDSFGNLFLVYLSQASTLAPTYVTLSLSTDGGATFSSPNGGGSALLLPYNPPALPAIGDQPTVSVGPGSAGFPGSVWVTYWTYGGIVASGAGVSGTGVIGTFTSYQPTQPAGVNFGDIAVGPKGEVIITYGPNGGNRGGIYVNVKPDGLGPAPFSNYSAVVNVNIGGFTPIPAQPDWGIDPEAGLAWDRSAGPYRGRVYLVFTDAPAVGSADTNIFVVHSDDLGVTWSKPVRVNDDAGANSQFLPRISLDQSNGVVAVTWYDARESPMNNSARYYGAFSSDGGATFARNFPIAAGTSNAANSPSTMKKADYGDYTGNAFVNGRLIAAWADNSNSTGDNPDGATTFDIYIDSIVVTSGGTFPSVSAASYKGGGAPLAPASMASGFGQALAQGAAQAQSQPLPSVLANTSVAVQDSGGISRQAQLVSVTPTQINYVIPEGTAVGLATLTVTSGTQITATDAVNIDTIAPGIFTANMDGKGAPAAQAVTVGPDMTQTVQPVAQCGAPGGSCVASPINLGPSGTIVVLVVYGTGIRGRSSLAGVTATIGGVAGQVLYAGPQSQYAGLDQVNVIIPRTVAGSGEVDLALEVDGKPANTVRISIR